MVPDADAITLRLIECSIGATGLAASFWVYSRISSALLKPAVANCGGPALAAVASDVQPTPMTLTALIRFLPDFRLLWDIAGATSI